VQYLKNIRVAIRLPFVVILALAALIAFATGTFLTLGAVKIGGESERQIAAHNTMLADIVPPGASLAPIDLVVMEAKDALNRGDAAEVAADVDAVEELVAVFRERHQYWEANAEGPEAELFAAIREPGVAYIDVLENEFIPAALAGDREAVDAADERLTAFLDDEVAAVDAASAGITAATEQITADATDLVSSRTTFLWTMLIATLVIVAAAALAVTRSVLKPLDELRHNLERIATGEAADARLDADRRDEFGQVATSFNAFADRLHKNAIENEQTARDAQARASEVSAAANIAAENMNTVAVATTELSAAASEIARSAGDASRTAETAVQAADHANALMERLAESSTRIGEVVESIRGIAAQTTMLALNATIEAARAGEAGRGFAVVASEVKDLAAETGTATADIVGRVDAIRDDTQAALIALAEVAHVITEISSSQSVIAAAVEEQAATTAEIDRSLTEAVTAVNQLAGTGPNHAATSNHHFTTAA
jgi:methyl-accepting chemotaxis protein